MNNEQICGYCGNKTTLNWVHGHGECSRCHTNIEECCSGDCGQGIETADADEKRLAEKDLKDEFSKMSVVQPDKQD
jgi:hypothetical protein